MKEESQWCGAVRLLWVLAHSTYRWTFLHLDGLSVPATMHAIHTPLKLDTEQGGSTTEFVFGGGCTGFPGDNTFGPSQQVQMLSQTVAAEGQSCKAFGPNNRSRQMKDVKIIKHSAVKQYDKHY